MIQRSMVRRSGSLWYAAVVRVALKERPTIDPQLNGPVNDQNTRQPQMSKRCEAQVARRRDAQAAMVRAGDAAAGA